MRIRKCEFIIVFFLLLCIFENFQIKNFYFTWCEEPVDGPAQGEMCSNLHSRSRHLSSILSFVSVTPRVTIFRSWQASANSYSHSWVIRQKKNSILFQLVMKVENLAPDTQGTQSSGVSGDLASCFLFSWFFFFFLFFHPPDSSETPS